MDRVLFLEATGDGAGCAPAGISAAKTPEFTPRLSSASAFAAGAGGFTVSLPVPPSVNGLFAGKARRHKSNGYRRWIEQAFWLAKSAALRPLQGPYALAILLATNERGDASNRFKAIEDLLVKIGATDDDRHNRLPLAMPIAGISKGACTVVAVPAHAIPDLLRFLADLSESHARNRVTAGAGRPEAVLALSSRCAGAADDAPH